MEVGCSNTLYILNKVQWLCAPIWVFCSIKHKLKAMLIWITIFKWQKVVLFSCKLEGGRAFANYFCWSIKNTFLYLEFNLNELIFGYLICYHLLFIFLAWGICSERAIVHFCWSATLLVREIWPILNILLEQFIISTPLTKQ